jgi:hypothetical protein
MKSSNVKVVDGICYTCGAATGVVNVIGIKLGAIKATEKGYCSHCAPNLHKED